MTMFKDYYTNRFLEIFRYPLSPSDGLGDEIIQEELSKLGFSISKALADYYSVAGNYPINKDHNQLYSLNELIWFGDMLVLMEENQAIAYWGVKCEDCNLPDPIVGQGSNIDPIEWELDDEPIDWYTEDYRISQFLMVMWKFTLTGEQEPSELAE